MKAVLEFEGDRLELKPVPVRIQRKAEWPIQLLPAVVDARDPVRETQQRGRADADVSRFRNFPDKNNARFGGRRRPAQRRLGFRRIRQQRNAQPAGQKYKNISGAQTAWQPAGKMVFEFQAHVRKIAGGR